MNIMKKKVFVALSGGVDSAVSALLLKNEGYDVTGVFMKNWSGEEYGVDDQCPWKRDLEDSINICKALGISHKTYNFEIEYRKHVINDFFDQYKKGNTPNPDVLCNKFIKFGYFFEKAMSEGADIIATGHYAVSKDGKLFRGIDDNKDQSYFLYQIKEKILEKTIFPIGNMQKPDVRKLAKKNNIPVAEKRDSQGICFVGKVNVEMFIERELGRKTGDFIDTDTGKVVGKHNGHWFYTNGQRKGIRIGGVKDPYYVCDKDVKKNIVFVAKGKSHSALYKSDVIISNLEMINNIDISETEDLFCQIRYRGEAISCIIEKLDPSRLKVKFSKPMFAPANGQSLVFYKGEQCLGGGTVESC